MNCAWIQDRILPFLAGELAPAEAIEVAHHLETCEACAAAAAELTETQAALEQLRREEVVVPESQEAELNAWVKAAPENAAAFADGGGEKDHGTAAHQGRWAEIGYQENKTAACNTWSAAQGDVS